MKRATGIHVELEPEWQRDFEIAIRLTYILPLVIKWCESDVCKTA